MTQGQISHQHHNREAFERKKVDYELDKMKDEKAIPLVIPDNAIALGMINIIYTMKLTEYQKYETTTVATNISNETMVEINENAADLKGVAVEQSYVRKYEDSIYFCPYHRLYRQGSGGSAVRPERAVAPVR